ncbi:MAG: hypothetical protein IIC40_00855 [Candidatus Marinimicrobia bacterium]|nr:hypothetical protein [Candidatus Neomarinimicrobiota bacterium]
MSEILRCKEDDLPVLFELFIEVYKHNPRMQERNFFDWQFKDHPGNENGEYSFWIEWDGSKIIGFLGYTLIEYIYDDKISTGCWSYNWYTSGSNGSGLNLIYKLWDEFDNRFHIGLSCASIDILNRLNVPLLSKMPRRIGIIDSETVFKLFSINDDSSRKILKSSEEQLSVYKDSGNIRFVKRFSDRDDFNFDDHPTVKGYVRRSGKFLNWRYFDIPGHNYKAITGPGNMFAVYRIEKIMDEKDSIIKIIDWNFSGEPALNALSFIQKDAIDSGAIMIDFFCTDSGTNKFFESNGFINEDSVSEFIPFLFRPLNLEQGAISLAIDIPPHMKKRNIDFSEWYISRGDGDIDRIKL